MEKERKKKEAMANPKQSSARKLERQMWSVIVIVRDPGKGGREKGGGRADYIR